MQKVVCPDCGKEGRKPGHWLYRCQGALDRERAKRSGVEPDVPVEGNSTEVVGNANGSDGNTNSPEGNANRSEVSGREKQKRWEEKNKEKVKAQKKEYMRKYMQERRAKKEKVSDGGM